MLAPSCSHPSHSSVHSLGRVGTNSVSAICHLHPSETEERGAGQGGKFYCLLVVMWKPHILFKETRTSPCTQGTTVKPRLGSPQAGASLSKDQHGSGTSKAAGSLDRWSCSLGFGSFGDLHVVRGQPALTCSCHPAMDTEGLLGTIRALPLPKDLLFLLPHCHVALVRV